MHDDIEAIGGVGVRGVGESGNSNSMWETSSLESLRSNISSLEDMMKSERVQ